MRNGKNSQTACTYRRERVFLGVEKTKREVGTLDTATSSKTRPRRNFYSTARKEGNRIFLRVTTRPRKSSSYYRKIYSSLGPFGPFLGFFGALESTGWGAYGLPMTASSSLRQYCPAGQGSGAEDRAGQNHPLGQGIWSQDPAGQ